MPASQGARTALRRGQDNFLLRRKHTSPPQARSADRPAAMQPRPEWTVEPPSYVSCLITAPNVRCKIKTDATPALRPSQASRTAVISRVTGIKGNHIFQLLSHA